MRRPHKKSTREQRTRWSWATRYGLSVEQVEAMKEEQGGCCAICDSPFGDKFRIDHNHRTGAVRGLLCHRCNLLIAGIEDQQFYERAIDYLMRADCREYGDMTSVIVIQKRKGNEPLAGSQRES